MGKWIGVKGCEIQAAREVDVDVEGAGGVVVANEDRVNENNQLKADGALTRRRMFLYA